MRASVRRLVVMTFHEFSEDRCSAMAAALAYYALFAMPALLLVAVYAAGAFYGRHAAAGRVQTQLTKLLGKQVASAIQGMLTGAQNRAGTSTSASVAAFGGLTFSAVAAVYELQQSLNRAWNVRVESFGTPNFILKRLISVLLIVGTTILLVASLAAAPALAALRSEVSSMGTGLLYAIEIAVPWAIFTVLLAVIMKVLPDAKIEWRDVGLGAALTSALIIMGKFLIGTYLGHSGFSSAYGAAGSIAALLIWAYYSAAILLLGVEFTQVWADQQGRQIEPEKGAIRLSESESESLPHSSAK